jgi:hypothetical protein
MAKKKKGKKKKLNNENSLKNMCSQGYEWAENDCLNLEDIFPSKFKDRLFLVSYKKTLLFLSNKTGHGDNSGYRKWIST